MAITNFFLQRRMLNPVFLMIVLWPLWITPAGAELSNETKKCIECHEITSAAVFTQWSTSKHAQLDIGCYECHQADQNSPDLFMHEGFSISIIVTPQDCARCHAEQVQSYEKSFHSDAANILNRYPIANELGNVVLGGPVVRLSCTDCHGSTVKIVQGGKIDPNSWPNTGVGRINPDGSRGSCSACHQRHKFSIAQARRPKTCGRCHTGPDKPQIQVYEESKHGISFDANEGLMNLDNKTWVVGENYFVGPTCSTCHLSAAPGLEATHDPTHRLTWLLRQPISERRENWQTNKNQMAKVCTECHSNDFITNWYKNYDTLVDYYNTKYIRPADSVLSKLRNAGKLTTQEFDDKVEWTYFLMWNYAGRQLRNGAAMQSNEYVKDGFVTISDYFYTEFIPDAKALNPDSVTDVLATPENQWYNSGGLIQGVSSMTSTPDLNQDGKVDNRDLFYFKDFWHR